MPEYLDPHLESLLINLLLYNDFCQLKYGVVGVCVWAHGGGGGGSFIVEVQSSTIILSPPSSQVSAKD